MYTNEQSLISEKLRYKSEKHKSYIDWIFKGKHTWEYYREWVLATLLHFDIFLCVYATWKRF